MSGNRKKNERLIPPKPSQSASITQLQTEFFSGPIPPPSYLARYNDVVPNGADRILSMAERQSAHRESLEAKVVDQNLKSQSQGQNRAFILALVIVLGGIYLMATGKNAWGFAAIITSLTALVSVFAIGKSEQRKERVEKSATLANRRNK